MGGRTPLPTNSARTKYFEKQLEVRTRLSERWTALTEWSLKNVSGAKTLRISIQGLYSCGECRIALRWLFCVYYRYLNSAYNAGV